MTIRAVGVNHAAFRVAVVLPVTVPPGSSVDLPVRFSPGRPGPQTATLTVQSDDPWRGEQTVFLTATALRRVGDITGDGLVDLNDFFALAEGFGKRAGAQGFDRQADLNGDGRVDLEDLFLLQEAMGRR